MSWIEVVEQRKQDLYADAKFMTKDARSCMLNRIEARAS